MVEVIGNSIFVNGQQVGTIHEYISSTRRVELGGGQDAQH